MKQPYLGTKIAALRKSKGMTQEALCQACGINIRSLQRIENGEVNPRTYTLKQLSKQLGEDLWSDPNQRARSDQDQSLAQAMKWGWMAGVAYFVLIIPDTILAIWRYQEDLDGLGTTMYLSVSLAVVVSGMIFFRSFALLGKKLGQGLLVISSYLLIILIVVIYSYDVMTIWWDLDREMLPLLTLLTFGAAGIFFGVGLSRIEQHFGTAAKTAAILELITGISFVLVITSFIGLITLLPAVIAEVLILYKAYHKYREPTGALSLGRV